MASDREESLEDLFNDVREAIGPMDLSRDSSDLTNGRAPAGASKVTQQAPLVNADATAFPTEMSCSQVFDQLLKCYSIGGQIRNYYRYGEINDCKQKRKQLKFCLGTRTVGEDERRERIKAWYMTALAEQQSQGQTSEVVWHSRAAPLRRPFREDSEKYLSEHSN